MLVVVAALTIHVALAASLTYVIADTGSKALTADLAIVALLVVKRSSLLLLPCADMVPSFFLLYTIRRAWDLEQSAKQIL